MAGVHGGKSGCVVTGASVWRGAATCELIHLQGVLFSFAPNAGIHLCTTAAVWVRSCDQVSLCGRLPADRSCHDSGRLYRRHIRFDGRNRFPLRPIGGSRRGSHGTCRFSMHGADSCCYISATEGVQNLVTDGTISRPRVDECRELAGGVERGCLRLRLDCREWREDTHCTTLEPVCAFVHRIAAGGDHIPQFAIEF